ncbi:MAG: dihydropteroate synthase [Actinomycetota bacterium]|nr:dihydropteroate synthase [Actinomycetota bacterium]
MSESAEGQARSSASVQRPLLLGRHSFSPDRRLVMAIVNRTPDSFYDKGRTYELRSALQRVHEVVAAGADLVDIGGVKAGPGEDVPADEEIRRTADLIAATREAYPDLVISVDTYRHEVADAACEAGADLINDAWGGVDRKLLEVAAEREVALVCTHAGGLPPRTRPHRVSYDDVMADILDRTIKLAALAVEAGVDRDRILLDPGHDFGKNTRHSLEASRRLGELVASGWPVLVSLSNKDFIGETLDLTLGERLYGTLAATAVSAWQGARMFRVHEVRETRQVLDMVSSIQGHRPPARTIRGLA